MVKVLLVVLLQIMIQTGVLAEAEELQPLELMVVLAQVAQEEQE
jgi:hypothetical protein|tara:strand:- start:248 stop:379 length:132 start_codon:yes stop_codon:yes gene_type:complete